ncbi:hypothetical protein DXT88_18520 [Herbaspirillum lusitanum]|nr:hypothetical protein [Herbaspirillum lusitanum]
MEECMQANTQVKPVNQSLYKYDLFTSLPQNSERVKEARRRKNQETYTSYKLLLEEFERASGYDLTLAKSILATVDPASRLNPSFHAAAHRAKEAMIVGDALECFRALKWIETAKHTVSHSGIQVFSPNGTLACCEAVTHIHQDQTLDVHGRRAEIFHTTQDEIAPYTKEFQQALALLKFADEDMHAETIELISQVTIFKAQAIMGGSLNRTFGAIFIASPDHDPIRGHSSYLTHRGVPYFLEHLVHESSHNVLFGLMLSDPMVLNPVSEKFSAPLRTDLRPMYGIFHAAFVVARMVRVFKLMVRKGRPEYQRLVDHFEPRLINGIRVVSEHGKLTPNGKRFFESFAQCGLL